MSRRERTNIGNIGTALIILIGQGIGLHLAVCLLFGVPLATVFYWLIPVLPAFLMALVHPNPQPWRTTAAR